MRDTNEFDDLEAHLRQGFRAPLPAAPWSLVERIESMAPIPAVHAPSRRQRLALLLVPAAVALLLIGVALNVGRRPSPPTSGFEMHPIGGFERNAYPIDLWVTGSTIYGMVWARTEGVEKTVIVRSKDAARWSLDVPPREGFVAASGTVVGDELHVIGYTGTFADPIWWHYAIDDGGWHEVGEMTGMPGSASVAELDHGAAGWLARIVMHEPEVAPGESGSAVRYSKDGLHWEEVATAPMGADVYYTGVTTDGTTLLVFRYLDTNHEGASTEALVTTDGEAWTVHTVPSTVTSRGALGVQGPRFAEYGRNRFVAVGSIESGAAWTAAAWTSTDAMTWVLQAVGQPGEVIPDDFRIITATAEGFAALSSESEVWVSRDGVTWRSLAVLRDGPVSGPFAAVALGDALIIGGSGPDGVPEVWLGRLDFR